MGASSKYTEKDFKFLGDELGCQFLTIRNLKNLAYFGMSNVPYLHNLNINYAEQKYYENPDFPTAVTKR